MAARGHPYIRTVETAERDAEIARYWIGRTIGEVAAHFGVNKATVSRARKRAIDAAVVPAGREAIAAELLKLDAWQETALAVLRANHVQVADGRVVRDGDQTVSDDRPVLMAIDRLLRIAERRARLCGFDAPSRAEVRVTDDLTAQIEELARELGTVTGAAGEDRSVADRGEERTPGPAPSTT
jgi:hypothetical protein